MVLFTHPNSYTGLAGKLKIVFLVFFFAGIANISFGQSQKAKQVPQSSIIDRSKEVSPAPKAWPVTKTEGQLKQEQAKLMKELCPNHPAYKLAPQQGAGTASLNAYESWKKSYPAEYAAYLKIFGFKYQ